MALPIVAFHKSVIKATRSSKKQRRDEPKVKPSAGVERWRLSSGLFKGARWEGASERSHGETLCAEGGEQELVVVVVDVSPL